jgi:hypothetical protein
MKASKKANSFPQGKRRTMRALFEILPVKNRNMIRCKLLASFYANKKGAASPKKTVIHANIHFTFRFSQTEQEGWYRKR